MFGVPMTDLRGQRITWCAPRPAERPNTFTTACFVEVGAGYLWTPAMEPLMPIDLSWPAGVGPDVQGLSVERRPVSFMAPMELTWVFDHWLHTGGPQDRVAAQLGVEIRVNGVMSPVAHVVVMPASNGEVRLPMLGQKLKFGLMGKDGHTQIALPAPGTPAELIREKFEKVDKSIAVVQWTPDSSAAHTIPLAGRMRDLSLEERARLLGLAAEGEAPEVLGPPRPQTSTPAPALDPAAHPK
jgi:hypothetical protein